MHTRMHSYRSTNALCIWQMSPPPHPWTFPSLLRTVLDWSRCFIIILFRNWNGIHWLTNYPFCFTYHTQNNVEFMIHLNSTEWVTVAAMHSNPQDGRRIGYIQTCLWAKRHISSPPSTLFYFLYPADARLAHSAQTLRSHTEGLH